MVTGDIESGRRRQVIVRVPKCTIMIYFKSTILLKKLDPGRKERSSNG